MTRRHLTPLPAIALLLSTFVAAQSPQTEERTLYASVVDKSNAPVAGMTPGDFIVREDGMAREVLRVSAATTPMHIALLVDNSQEVDPVLLDLRRGLAAFIKTIGPENDIAIIGVGERPTLLQDYTRDKARLQAAAGKIFPRMGAGTHVLEAIIESSEGLRKRKAERPVIVVFTAEGAEFSDSYHQTVLDAMHEVGATLHVLRLQTRRGAGVRDQPKQELDMTIADGTAESGGRREELITSMGLDKVFSSLAEELNHQYQVVYSRPRTLVPPKERQVTVKRPELTVRASQTP